MFGCMLGYFIPEVPVSCFWDAMFDLTDGANKWINENKAGRNVFFITCGLMMDITMVTSFYFFVKN